MIRGWFSREASARLALRSEQVVSLMQALITEIPAHVSSVVLDCIARYFKNWQGTFLMKKDVSADECRSFAKALNQYLQTTLNGNPLYAIAYKS